MVSERNAQPERWVWRGWKIQEGFLGRRVFQDRRMLFPACVLHSAVPALTLLISTVEHCATVLASSWVELGTEREGFLQMLDKNADFRGQPAAGRPHGKDWHGSLKGCEKTDHGTFSKFCSEEPRWGLGNPQMFKDTHPHLFDITGSKDSIGGNTLRVSSSAKRPWLYGAPFDKNDRLKAVETVRRFRCTMSCEVLRSGDENGHRLRESSRNQSRVWEVP